MAKSDIEVFSELLGKRYFFAPPTGVKVESVELTTLDLYFQFEEFCEPTLAEISSYLLSQNAEFFFDHWRLYEKAEYIQHSDPS